MGESKILIYFIKNFTRRFSFDRELPFDAYNEMAILGNP